MTLDKTNINLFKVKQDKLKNHSLKNQSGQFILEYLLIAVLVIGAYSLINNLVGEQNLMSKVFAGPWASIAKMMEEGTWDKSLGEDDAHPLRTIQSRRGDTE